MKGSRRLISLFAVTVALAAGAVWSRQAAADEGGCKTYSGPFTSVTVGAPPTGTLGHLGGELDAKYEFTFTSMVPTADPTVLLYTGVSTITTSKGIIYTDDIGILQFTGPTTATFITTAQITGGTLRYKNASGVFVAPGALDFITGQAVGTYTAEICHGNGKKSG
jgi:hypothetical protein